MDNKTSRKTTGAERPGHTPYPPGRICPVCGSPVGRYDGALFCIPRVGCLRDEVTAHLAALEAMEDE